MGYFARKAYKKSLFFPLYMRGLFYECKAKNVILPFFIITIFLTVYI